MIIQHDPRSALLLDAKQFDCHMIASLVEKGSRLSPLEAQPPHWKRRMLLINVEVVNDDRVALVIGGNTYPCRASFEALDIQVRFFDVSGKEEYFRVVPEFDATDAARRVLITQVLGAACLKNTVVAYCTTGSWTRGSSSDSFLEFLSCFPGVERVLR